MTDHELEKVANRVAEILSQSKAKANDTFDGMCAVAGPPRPVINDKLVDEVVNNCQNAIISNCHSDEEQFLAIGQLRERMTRYWDDMMRSSNELSSFNTNRAQALGKFIEMTIPR